MNKFKLLLSVLLFNAYPAFNQSFNPIWEYTDFGSDAGIANLLTRDLNGDGLDEIIFGNELALYVTSFGPNKKYTSKTIKTESNISDFEVADIDKDGKPEIIALDYLGKIYLFDGMTLKTKFIQSTDTPQALTMAVDDIDGDGKTEVVIGSFSAFKIFTIEGNFLYALNTSLPIFDCIDIAIGDVDGDGKKEIVHASQTGGNPSNVIDGTNFTIKWTYQGTWGKIRLAKLDNTNQLKIISLNNETLSVFNAVTKTNIWSINPNLGTPTGLAIADLDDDQMPEILIGSTYFSGSHKIVAYRFKETSPLFSIPTDNDAVLNITTGNTDTDSNHELIWTTGTLGSRSGLNIMDGKTLLPEDYQNRDFVEIEQIPDDIDQDGKQEIVISASEYLQKVTPTIRIFDASTHNENVTIILDSLEEVRELAIGSTRTTNQKELVWLDQDKVYVMDYATKQIIWSISPNNFRLRTVAFANVDNDTALEILVATTNGVIYSYDYKGTTYQELKNFKITIELAGTSQLRVFDHNNDGIPDIVFKESNQIKSINYSTQQVQWVTNNTIGYINSYTWNYNDKTQSTEIYAIGSQSIVYTISGKTGLITKSGNLPSLPNGSFAVVAIGDLTQKEEGKELLVVFKSTALVLKTTTLEILSSFSIPDISPDQVFIRDLDKDSRPEILISALRGVYHFESDEIVASKELRTKDVHFNLMPNPAFQLLNVEINSIIDNYEVSIYDLSGKKLIHKPIKRIDQPTIDVTPLPSGVYSVVLTYAGACVSKLLVKQ